MEHHSKPSSLEVSNGSTSSSSRRRSSSSLKSMGLRRNNPASMGTVSSVLGKNYVWRVANKPNGNPNETKTTSATHLSEFDQTLVEESKDANMNMDDDVENFLFEMLGKGFQLERSSIHDVLGQCGYDMKKSLETLLELTAATLDKQYDVQKGRNLHSNSNQDRKQTISERNKMIHEQEKAVLTSLFHAPERPDSNARSSIAKSSQRSRATDDERVVVVEPSEDLSSVEHTVIDTKPRLSKTIEESEDSPYQILRKAVKEHRDTMKEYYTAATEAFANGDRARATLLLEKGQFYYNKAREADEESAKKIFETSHGNGEVQEDMSLDLRDHQAKEAIQLVKCHLRSLSGIPSFKNLRVMTGNDGRDAEKRKRLVIKLFERESIEWTQDEAEGTILIRLDEIKPQTLSFAKK